MSSRNATRPIADYGIPPEMIASAGDVAFVQRLEWLRTRHVSRFANEMSLYASGGAPTAEIVLMWGNRQTDRLERAENRF